MRLLCIHKLDLVFLRQNLEPLHGAVMFPYVGVRRTGPGSMDTHASEAVCLAVPIDDSILCIPQVLDTRRPADRDPYMAGGL